jgi:biotin carboxylase
MSSNGVDSGAESHVPGTLPTVVALSARNPHIFAHLCGILRDRHYRIVSVADTFPWDALLAVDIPIMLDLADWQGVEAQITALAQRVPIAAVISHVETQVPLMAFLNERLGYTGTLSLEAARNCRDKLRTRECLAACAVPSARFQLARTPDEAVHAAELLGLPVVVKPRDGTAGYAVRLGRTIDEVAAGAEAVLAWANAQGRLPTILVEEYLDGREFAVQTVSRAGQVQIVSIFEELLGPLPLFVEVGYDYPVRLDEDQQASIANVVQRALLALGVDNWVTHTQVRLTAEGPKIVEVNARVPGGQLLRMTTVVSGVDLLVAAVELALGLPLSSAAPQARVARYRSIVFDAAGTLTYAPLPSLDCLESRIPPIVELDVQLGDPVLPVDHPDGGVYGRMLVFGEDAEMVARDYQRIEQALHMHVTPPQNPALVGEDTRPVKRCC